MGAILSWNFWWKCPKDDWGGVSQATLTWKLRNVWVLHLTITFFYKGVYFSSLCLWHRFFYHFFSTPSLIFCSIFSLPSLSLPVLSLPWLFIFLPIFPVAKIFSLSQPILSVLLSENCLFFFFSFSHQHALGFSDSLRHFAFATSTFPCSTVPCPFISCSLYFLVQVPCTPISCLCGWEDHLHHLQPKHPIFSCPPLFPHRLHVLWHTVTY